MNRKFFIPFLTFAFFQILIFSLSGCGSKSVKQETWVAPEHEAITRQMPDLELTDSTTLGGHTYVYSILRTPCDSLEKVKDDMDDLYLDNTIRLTLHRDGAVYFDHTFTKATFAPSIDKGFYVFSFAVSYPDSDMSIPFLMTITDQGTFTFVKDENLDHEEGDSVFYDADGV